MCVGSVWSGWSYGGHSPCAEEEEGNTPDELP